MEIVNSHTANKKQSWDSKVGRQPPEAAQVTLSGHLSDCEGWRNWELGLMSGDSSSYAGLPLFHENG